MARDLDLIAIPWKEELLPYEAMLKEMAEYMGGEILNEYAKLEYKRHEELHGRMQYIININRIIKTQYKGTAFEVDECADPQMYIDISVMIPPTAYTKACLTRLNEIIEKRIDLFNNTKLDCYSSGQNNELIGLQSLINKEITNLKCSEK
jgi:hypothetical protein